MKQRITLQFAALLLLMMSLPLAAKVTGLPDFTELVEKAGPAVVNIQVTQFGERARNDHEKPPSGAWRQRREHRAQGRCGRAAVGNTLRGHSGAWQTAAGGSCLVVH